MKRVPRIEFDFADLGREEDHVLPILPQMLTLCPNENIQRVSGGHDVAVRCNTWTQCGDAALKPRTRVGTAVKAVKRRRV